MTAVLTDPTLVQQMIDAALDQYDTEVAAAIADALRTYADRPVGDKGSLSIQFGEVVTVYDNGYADVKLDGQGTVPCTVLSASSAGTRVAVLFYPPSGALVLGPFTGTPTSPGGGTGDASRNIADRELPGSVVAGDGVEFSPIVANGTITHVVVTLGSAPSTGTECVIDVLLNGVSLWADPLDRPTFTDSTTNPLVVALATPIAVVAFVDLITMDIVSGAGRFLYVVVVGV